MLDLLAAVVRGFISGLSGGDKSRRARLRGDDALPSRVAILGHVKGLGRYDLEAVGESKYQPALESIAGGRRTESVRLKRQAVLYLDDANPVDKQAVRVVIEGATVGYLARAHARQWRAGLVEQGLLGHFTCDAIIIGGWDRGAADRGYFGVRLDVPME